MFPQNLEFHLKNTSGAIPKPKEILLLAVVLLDFVLLGSAA
jgi:hypothetical protein